MSSLLVSKTRRCLASMAFLLSPEGTYTLCTVLNVREFRLDLVL